MKHRGVEFSIVRARGVWHYSDESGTPFVYGFRIRRPVEIAKKMNARTGPTYGSRTLATKYAKIAIDETLAGKSVAEFRRIEKASVRIQSANQKATQRRLVKLDDLSMGELRALVKLAVTRKVLVPSAAGSRYYHSLWQKGWALYVLSAGGYTLNLEHPQETFRALGMS
jgi:hypothetical protein